MIKLAKERRIQKRKQISLPVFYEYTEKHEHLYDHGTTFDISDSGICFYGRNPLLENLSIQVHVPDLWDKPKYGSVRWCSMKNFNFYKIGVILH